VVCVDRAPSGVNVDVVVADNREAAAVATRHLLSRGHRRIGFLCDESTLMTAQERHRGFQDAMAEAGVEVSAEWVRFDVDSVDDGDVVTRQLLSGRQAPTALFTAQNYVTMGAYRALHQLQRQESVALIGFDDFAMADVLQPGVTVISQDARRMGREAAEVLFRRMDGDTSPISAQVVPCSLVTRGSGEIPPA